MIFYDAPRISISIVFFIESISSESKTLDVPSADLKIQSSIVSHCFANDHFLYLRLYLVFRHSFVPRRTDLYTLIAYCSVLFLNETVFLKMFLSLAFSRRQIGYQGNDDSMICINFCNIARCRQDIGIV